MLLGIHREAIYPTIVMPFFAQQMIIDNKMRKTGGLAEVSDNLNPFLWFLKNQHFSRRELSILHHNSRGISLVSLEAAVFIRNEHA